MREAVPHDVSDTKWLSGELTRSQHRQPIENKPSGFGCDAEEGNPGELKSEGNSHDVVENTCRKNVLLGVSHDVYENKGTYLINATMLMKTKIVIPIKASEYTAGRVRRAPAGLSLPAFLLA